MKYLSLLVLFLAGPCFAGSTLNQGELAMKAAKPGNRGRNLGQNTDLANIRFEMIK